MTTTAVPVVGACGPVVPVSVVPSTEIVTPLSATPPIVAVAADWNAHPLMVTDVPPEDGPFVGAMAVTVGGGRLGAVRELERSPRGWPLEGAPPGGQSGLVPKAPASTRSIP